MLAKDGMKEEKGKTTTVRDMESHRVNETNEEGLMASYDTASDAQTRRGEVCCRES